MERGEDFREFRHHPAEKEKHEPARRKEHDGRVNESPSRRPAQLVHVGEVRGQRAQCRRQLGGRFPGRDDGGDMRRKLPREEPARRVDRHTLRHRRLDVAQQSPDPARRSVLGELGQRHVRGHAGPQLQFQLVQECDKLTVREDQPRHPGWGDCGAHLDGPQRAGTQPVAQLRLVVGLLMEDAGAPVRADGVDDEGGHVRAGDGGGRVFPRPAGAGDGRCDGPAPRRTRRARRSATRWNRRPGRAVR